jgi:hypothetical protein
MLKIYPVQKLDERNYVARRTAAPTVEDTLTYIDTESILSAAFRTRAAPVCVSMKLNSSPSQLILDRNSASFRHPIIPCDASHGFTSDTVQRRSEPNVHLFRACKLNKAYPAFTLIRLPS